MVQPTWRRLASVRVIPIVAAYCFIDILLLLCTISPAPSISMLFREIIWIANLGIIPGLAAVFSWFYGGPHGLRNRAVNIFLVGTFGLPIFILPIVSVVILIGWVNRYRLD